MSFLETREGLSESDCDVKKEMSRQKSGTSPFKVFRGKQPSGNVTRDLFMATKEKKKVIGQQMHYGAYNEMNTGNNERKRERKCICTSSLIVIVDELTQTMRERERDRAGVCVRQRGGERKSGAVNRGV